MQRQRLTKKYLFSLDSGVILASNAFNRDEEGRPFFVFHEYVPELADREQVWAKIKQVEADGRLCYVFKNEEDFNERLKSIANL